MKTLICDAGVLGCLDTHRLFQAGKDVVLIARGKQRDFIKEHGVVMLSERGYQYEGRIEEACLNSIP